MKLVDGVRVFALLLALVHGVRPHGKLIEPPSRSSMWRYGWDTPKNYDDNELFCGGFNVQHNENGGKCGICGDNYALPQPRENEAGGLYGNGIITRTYTMNQDITIKVQIDSNHLGYFEFNICPNNNPSKIATPECFHQYLLEQADGSGPRYTLPFRETKVYELKYKLPTGLTCSQCVIQWRYVAGNNWNWCGDGTGALGCGPQENFRGCSDVAINSSGGDDSTTMQPGGGDNSPWSNNNKDTRVFFLDLKRR